MLMKMMIAAAMTCNVVQAWSTPLGTVYDPSNPCMRSCLEILYDSHCVDACRDDQDPFLLLRDVLLNAETSNAETKKTHTRRGGLGAPVEATESARAQTEQVAETSNAEKKKTHTRRGGLGAPVEATESARAQTKQVAETSNAEKKKTHTRSSHRRIPRHRTWSTRRSHKVGTGSDEAGRGDE